MNATVWELLDLIARWIHVIAGIMWVGNSLLFNWLDRNLRPDGTIWLLHSGGFYHVEKTLLHGESVPRPLHWFKWQAYTTWLSGVALLIVVYYVGGRAIIADPSADAHISHLHACVMAIAGIVTGWGVYEAMQRFVAPRAPRIATAIWMTWLALVSFAFVNHLNGRAAFLHVGALLATIMAGNVAMTIVPSQRALVAAVEAGGAGASALANALSARAKRVSIHNNYFTFPVIALMVSNHFPSVTGHRWSWLLLAIIVASGVAVRHVLNQRFVRPRWRRELAATLGIGIAALAFVLELPTGPEPSSVVYLAGDVSFADARHIIDRRCAACHSATPTDRTFGVAPAGVMFDTPEQIVARAARIRERAIVTQTMPPANRTGITDEERAVLARWLEQGARPR